MTGPSTLRTAALLPTIAAFLLAATAGMVAATTVCEAGLECEASVFELEETVIGARTTRDTQLRYCRLSGRCHHAAAQRHCVRRGTLPLSFLAEHSARNGLGAPLTT